MFKKASSINFFCENIFSRDIALLRRLFVLARIFQYGWQEKTAFPL